MKAYIKAVSYYLPRTILSNEEISRNFPEWSTEKIAQKVGITERHIAGKNETAGDMAVLAAEKLFSEHHVNRKDIDFLQEGNKIVVPIDYVETFTLTREELYD